MEKSKALNTMESKTIFGFSYQQIVLSILKPLKRGHLRLTMPNGEILTFGNGEGVHAEMVIHDSQFFRRCALYGDIGLGEGYMYGEWSSSSVTNVIKWFLYNIDGLSEVSGGKGEKKSLNLLKLYNLFIHRMNKNTIAQGEKNIHEHYDLSNDFFQLFLDPTMTYSSAVFNGDFSVSLEQAQKNKYQRLCEQLQLKKSDHLLEVGSGWGGMAIYAAQNYGCRVTSITISKEQLALAQKRVKEAQLDHLVEIRYLDYRKLEGKYDKIVSIEMIEAVGDEYFESYFKKLESCLKKDGLLAIQAITSPDSRYDIYRKSVDWIQKYIFPGGLLPSVAKIHEINSKHTELQLHSLYDFGRDYAETLRRWRDAFFENEESIKKLGMDQVFMRKWDYYFSYCEAAFDMHNISCVHLTFTRPNNLNLK